MALNMDAAIRIKAGVDGEQSIDRLNNKLRDVGRQGEMSAKQIRQAYQTLPAQFQDIAVSLAGGQNPFMVLLQQGSQISTQFGGMGNAIKGITSLITPARVAFTGLAGAIGAFALAAIQGYQEGIQLQRQLAITGNFAGMTADSFERSAARIQAASGATAAATREMLMGAAGSGAFGPASIDAVTQAMVRLQRLTGQSSEDVIKQFRGMSKGVADWAVETNRSYNFLNVEQYKYIRQLEEQGRQEQAMIVASNALNEALKTRTVELGYLERGWKAVKEGASNAWNAMLNIGRPDTLADQISAIETRLRNSEAIRERMRERGQPVPEKGPQILALEAELAALREVAALQGRAAEATANRARANQDAITAERKAEDDRKRAASEAESMEKQRLSLIQGLRDEVTKLTDGEDELTLTRLRGLGATQQQINVATELLRQRKEAAAGAERNKELERQQQEAAKELARQEESRKQVLKGLNDQVLTMTMGEDELVLARLRSANATEEEIAAAKRLQGALARLREEKKQEAEAKSIFEATRTPAEKLNIELARLNALLDSGKINWDTYSRAVFKAQDEFDELGKKGKDSMDEIARAIDGWGKQAADTFVQFAFTGKATFNDFVNSVLQDIARMMIYQAVTKPLFNAIGKFFGFADGGVMTPGGPLPLRAYSRGGIANSPQVAVYGEGRQPEAYVPLPDGRTIPVTLQGTQDEQRVLVQLDNGPLKAFGSDMKAFFKSMMADAVSEQRQPSIAPAVTPIDLAQSAPTDTDTSVLVKLESSPLQKLGADMKALFQLLLADVRAVARPPEKATESIVLRPRIEMPAAQPSQWRQPVSEVPSIEVIQPQPPSLVPVRADTGVSQSNNVVVNVNMTTGQEQVQVQDRAGAGALGKAIAAAVRTELINQRRPGGLLAA